jgi:hypothetical protein
MKKMSAGFIIVAALATALSTLVVNPLLAQDSNADRHASSQAPSVTGRWNASVDSPHGAMSLNLVLEQHGTKVTGSFSHAEGGGEFALEGEFTDGTLKLSATVDGAHHGGNAVQMTFSATLKADGTLAGNLSGAMGDMTWTAARAKGL